jgi:hypothetical protein
MCVCVSVCAQYVCGIPSVTACVFATREQAGRAQQAAYGCRVTFLVLQKCTDTTLTPQSHHTKTTLTPH